MITAEQFKQATGHEPVQDDLERCNCPKAGEIGHLSCGWDEEKNLPQFMTGSRLLKGEKVARSPASP